MKRSILLAVCLAFMLSSCEHNDYIEPDIENPVFTISGYRNGQPFTLSAGDNGLIQSGTIERNKFGVMAWTSSFISATCPTCEPEFSITLNDREGMSISECDNLEIFSNDQLAFAQEASASDFQECELSIEGLDELEDVSFVIPGSTMVDATSFSFDTEGTYEVTADFELEVEGSSESNDIHIYQSIYAGSHQRVAVPFLYEVMENEDDEQEIRLIFPEIPELRASRWEINGVSESAESIIRTFENNIENRIAIFYVNDVTGVEGSYTISFNHGFPIDESCDEDHHIIPAPGVNVDWATGVPNYERAFITYKWQGKTYISTTSLNNGSTLSLLGYQDYTAGLQGSNAVQLNTTFSVKLVELGNESNILELTDCRATFGFVTPH